jgi:hypothetical protein
MLIEDLIPPADDKQLLSFCASICPDVRPFLVPVRPQDGCLIARCFPNVEQMIRSSAGSLIQGWDISHIPKIHLEATWHAVWKSPHGDIVDVTPQESGQSVILFLPDVHLAYNGSLVPSKRFSIGDIALIRRYWDLSDAINKLRLELWSAGFQRGHPVWRQRLEGMNAELLALKWRLQKAA